MKKKKRRLLIQVLSLTVAFYVIAMALSAVTMYRSSRRSYLSAKNDMIQRDLKRVGGYLTSLPGIYWYFDYSRTNADQIRVPMTEEEAYIALKELPEDQTEAYRYLETLSTEAQLAYAKDLYNLIQYKINSDRSDFGYGGLFCIDIRDGSLGFVYHEAAQTDKDGLPVDGNSKLGAVWYYKPDDHPAIQRLQSGRYSDVEFEIASTATDEGGNYYIGYMPLEFGNEIKAVLCLDYNWDSFHSELMNEVRFMIGLMLIGMVVSCAMLMLLLNRLAIKPLSILQHSVRDYIKTKDSLTVKEHLKEVRPNNEIGVLSVDVEELADEMNSYIKGIKELTAEVMEALAHTIDAKDKYTNGHSSRVALYSTMIAKKLGLSAKEQEDIYYMGLLHDIGKIGIPNSIINKPTQLTEEEYEIVKKHPVYGYEILSEIKSMPALSIGARWHHERFDGKGYPDGLAGDRIPLNARIIAVADSYDTMTSNRSYRKYLPQYEVREEIEKNIGTQFDPEPARVMLDIIDDDINYTLHD